MNLTIGFCEIALVTSLFFYPQSRWIGITLLCIAILGKIIGFALIWNEKIERAKELKDANKNLAKSLENFAVQLKPGPSPQKKSDKVDVRDFIFDNYVGSKEDN